MSDSRRKAVCSGTLFDGLVDCYVLDDGRRVISQRGVVRALTGGGRSRGDISTYIDRLPEDSRHLALAAAIEFRLPSGGTANGRDAEWVVDVLQAYVDAHFDGELHPSQEHLAKNASRILRVLGKVGLAALIDEATGYERAREEGALARLFDRLFRAKAAPWERMFSDALVLSLCRLDGIDWKGGRHPRHLASTQRSIYDRILSAKAGDELRRRNPSPSRGSNHHQHLSAEAQEDLRQQLTIVEVIANQSRSKADFWARMDRQYDGAYLQLDLEASR